jgi:peptide/nickel transport system permease protein
MAVATPPRRSAGAERASTTARSTTLQRFLRYRPGVIGLIVLLLLALLTIIVPLVAGFDPAAADANPWARAFYAGRLSLLIAFGALLLGDGIGLLLAIVVGTSQGIGNAIGGVANALLAWPLLPIALVLLALFGPSVGTLIVVLALLRWPNAVRLVRDRLNAINDRSYVQAARALNASSGQIMTRHLLPHVLPAVAANAALGFGSLLLLEGAISFLGFGVPAGSLSWGSAVRLDGDMTSLWQIVLPGLLLTFAALCTLLIGEGLRRTTEARVRL